MPTYLYNANNAVLDEGIYLPKFLYYFEDPRGKSITPVAAFNPDDALNNTGFSPSISAAATRVCDKIIRYERYPFFKQTSPF